MGGVGVRKGERRPHDSGCSNTSFTCFTFTRLCVFPRRCILICHPFEGLSNKLTSCSTLLLVYISNPEEAKEI